MSNLMTMYTMFDQSFQNKIQPIYTLNYYFINSEGEKEELTLIDDSIGTVLDNQYSTWEFRYFGLIIEGDIVLNNIHYLFGPNGLVADNAVIGVALQITSKKSLQQYIYPIGEISKDLGHAVSITFEKTIDKNKFYGGFDINICLYVKEASNNPIVGKANFPGLMLGTIINQTIDIDGSMSALPIQKVADPSKPLWFIDLDIDDATIDPFDVEHVCIYLNTAHPAFKYLEKNDSSSVFLQNEVMASALTHIISYVQTLPEWDSIYGGENLEEGSIGAAIFYFKSTFNWNFESPTLLSESIRSYFDSLGGES